MNNEFDVVVYKRLNCTFGKVTLIFTVIVKFKW